MTLISRRRPLARFTLVSTLALMPGLAAAQESEAPSLAQIVVVGTRDALQGIAGSGTVIDEQVLERAQVFTLNEALRLVPGVFPRDEEGLGLRPNIGIRGLSPTRSSKVLLLEDGLPLAYAPYGDNASYYHPPIERFERIEVLKGASQIRFGPSTIGGVVNYITPAAPAEPEARLSLNAGNRGYLEIDAAGGAPALGGRWLLHVNRKESDGSRENHALAFTDIYAKADYELGADHALTVRASRFAEDSQVSYSGLTLAEYRADPRQNPFPNDRFDTSRWSLSLLHGWRLSPGATLRTAVYLHRFERDWWRQSSNSLQRPSDASDPACGGMANLSTTCGNEGRLRDYWTYGAESRLSVDHSLGQTNLGVRLHREEQHRLQINGDTPTARTAGTGVNAGLKEHNERKVLAISAFVDQALVLGPVSLLPGIRFESIDYTRINNPLSAGQARIRGTARVNEWIPGIGATWRAGPELTVYAGVHRGFAPPAVSDIITAQGGSVDLEAERSWNYELGMRASPVAGLSGDASLFYMNFSNQVVPASIAGGVGASLTNAGETRHRGVELALDWSARSAGLMRGNDVYWRTAITWVEDASYRGTRLATPPCPAGSPVGTPVATGSGPRACGIATDVNGNRLPYAPKWLASATLGYAWGDVATLQADLQHQSAMYADDLNLIDETADGQRGRIKGWAVVNLAARVAVPGTPWTLSATIKNLFDTLYIADRSRGILPGTPRLLQAGVSARF